MARAGLGSPLRNIAGQALALAPVAGGVPNTPYPYCVRLCPCVRLCLVPCDLRRSEIYLQCFACRRVACVSRGALGDMCRVACDRRRPPVIRPSLVCRSEGCSPRLCCVSACVRCRACVCCAARPLTSGCIVTCVWSPVYDVRVRGGARAPPHMLLIRY